MLKKATKPGTARRGIDGALAVGFAIDSNQGPNWGWAVDYETVQLASEWAVNRCGVQSCRVVMTFYNQCGAFAADQTRGSTAYGWAKTNTAYAAQNMALDYCRQRGGASCIVRAWGCTSRSAAGGAP